MMSIADFKGQKLLLAIGLFLVLAVLAGFFLYNQNKAGTNSIIAIQDSIVQSAQRTENVKARNTIVNFADNLKTVSVGDYKLDTETMYVINVNGTDKVESTDGALGVAEPTATAGKLTIAFMPTKQIAGDYTDKVIELKGKSVKADGVNSGNAVTDAAGLAKINDYLKGYVTDGYIVFFASDFTKETAKSFRDKYFPAGTVVQSGTTNTKFGIAVDMNS